MKNIIFHVGSQITSCIGFFWLFLKFTDYFFPVSWLNSWLVFWIIVLISLIYSFYVNLPWKSIKLRISGSDAYISIHFKDILSENENIVITTSNTFTTDLKLVSDKSLLGQYILKNFSGNNTKIEEGIERSLRNISTTPAKGKKGKPNAYPIGTVAVFDALNNKKGFLVAITEIVDEGDKTHIITGINHIVNGLEELWQKVETEIHDEPLDMVPIGAGISHIFTKTIDSVLFTALDFARRSRLKRPCSELRIFVRKKDFPINDYIYLKQALATITN